MAIHGKKPTTIENSSLSVPWLVVSRKVNGFARAALVKSFVFSRANPTTQMIHIYFIEFDI